MNLDVANVRDAELAHVTGEGTSLAQLHVSLMRHLATHEGHRGILVDLRHVDIDAGSGEVPVFIDFLKLELLPELKARSNALAILTDEQSAATPLGAIIAALSNLNQFSENVVIAHSFDEAYRTLETNSGEDHG